MKSLEEITKKMIEYLETTEMFLNDQVPDFVAQFIIYETWAAEWWFLISLCVFILLCIWQALNILYIFTKTNWKDGFVFIIFFVGTFGALSLYSVTTKFASLKKLQIAPKVYMVERAKSMLK